MGNACLSAVGASAAWFENEFGFSESTATAASFGKVQSVFKVYNSEQGVKLHSTANNRVFHVGVFETPSLAELRRRLHELRLGTQVSSKQSPQSLGKNGVMFQNIAGDAKKLHLDPENAGAVFQAASQFNCLEMTSPDRRPEDGVADYYYDMTQGPACAMACPAATVFRNYFCNGPWVEANSWGTGHVNQIDTLCDVATLLNNDKHRYWTMKNGYVLPRPGALQALGTRLSTERTIMPNAENVSASAEGEGNGGAQHGREVLLAEAVTASLRVGVHWDTDTALGREGVESHRVCQVFSSALPIAYWTPRPKMEECLPFARAVLNGQYEATLLVAAILSRQRGRRVKVFLTSVGGGAFGNPSKW
eukprot:CAMPEP_0181294178 /NCGR_PEP_ID=MMETSP1101-20121128/3456_1 /TAXON_ID=46948 /ORGANISM="Rhodomonas abbreviata, Strain Caron Lab Isolate" /LENGTH=362 /DNA_ID=CAMNT_0023398807 /DNA_START=118 /DNA_END=1203 /DNA_ORIENTATION=-